MAEALEPRASISAIAHRVGIHPSQLFAWRRDARTNLRSTSHLPPSEAIHTNAIASDPAVCINVASTHPLTCIKLKIALVHLPLYEFVALFEILSDGGTHESIDWLACDRGGNGSLSESSSQREHRRPAARALSLPL
ncbi:transposase [Sinorhizobium arboris]|uniref:transposase n=1 Tax=Sinorhizobium arboris TaxID=76745 RepID=UPI0009FDB9B1